MAKKQAIRQDPAYQLYTSDFLVRNLHMSDEQAGRYIRLLCFQHQNGHMPESIMISFCKGVDSVVFAKFLIDNNGLYYNEEMELEIQRRTGISKTNSKNATIRWDKEKNEPEEK